MQKSTPKQPTGPIGAVGWSNGLGLGWPISHGPGLGTSCTIYLQ